MTEPLFSFVWEGKAVGVNNRYVGKTKKVLSPGYRKFKESIAWIAMVQNRRSAKTYDLLYLRISMRISKMRDSDSLLKPLFDGIEASKVLLNDRQIRGYTVMTFDKKRGETDRIEVKAYLFEGEV